MDSRMFRDAMGRFATGVNVITTEVDDEIHGMTANAFMSVSLDPMLVVISIGEKARTLEKIRKSKKFAVSILSQEQKQLSMLFAGQLKDVDDEISFDRLAGLPVIPDAHAQIACEVTNEYVEGDHVLFIGKVIGLYVSEDSNSNPLLFYRGKYTSLEKSVTVS